MRDETRQRNAGVRGGSPRRSQPRKSPRAGVRRISSFFAIALAMLLAGSVQTTAMSAAAADDLTAVAPGSGMLIKSLNEAQNSSEDKYSPTMSIVEINPDDASGYVHIVFANGKCLTDQWTYNNPGSWGDRVHDQIEQNCSDSHEKQKFYLVPLASEPSSGSSPAGDNHLFSIVSAYTGHCFYSTHNGLHGWGNMEAWNTNAARTPPRGFIGCGNDAYWKPNAAGKTGSIKVSVKANSQHFGVYNDSQYSDGTWTHWKFVLEKANKQGIYQCVSDGGASCSVKLPGGTTWLSPTDPAVTASGTQVTRLAGCGVPVDGGGNVTFHNNSSQVVNQSVSSSISTSHETTVSDSHGVSIGIHAKGGVKDVWEVGGDVTYSYNHERAEAQGSGASNSVTTSVDVPAYSYFMLAWDETVYELGADWRLGEHDKLTGWQTHVDSVFPTKVGGREAQTSSLIITATKKNCLAGPASTSSSPPVLASSATECSAKPSLPDAVPGATVYACAGDWAIPKVSDPAGSADPVYGYQWYYVDVDGDAHDIPNATRAEFTLQEESFLASHTFLGVRVAELGDAYRLESAYVAAPASLSLASAAPQGMLQAATSAEPVAPSFTAAEISMVLGQQYDRSLIADADLTGSRADGSALDLTTAGPLPSGLELTAEGMLIGTPSEAGTFEFAVHNGSGVEGDTPFVLTVHGESARFVADAEISGVAGVELSQSLVDSASAVMQLEVTRGSLPAGLVLDPGTGLLAGTPATATRVDVEVVDQNDPFAHAHDFTMVIAPAPHESGMNPIVWAAIGAGVILIGGVLGGLYWRSRRARQRTHVDV